jgi:CDP-4-dehydro-6-deoxyglucose reductase
MKATLLSTTDLAPGVRHFRFRALEVDVLTFVPGQFVSLKGHLNGSEYVRAYSIASEPDGNTFELCLNLVPGGIFSAHLFSLEPGAEIEFTPPLGYFTLRNRDRDAVMIATGTGIAPFRSMLRGSLQQITSKVTVLFGTRYQETVLYGDEWRELEQRHSHFHFWPTLTRPAANWSGRTGRVQAHLDEVLEGRTDLDVYLCGLEQMVDDLRRLLKQKGFDRKQIIYEKYD